MNYWFALVFFLNGIDLAALVLMVNFEKGTKLTRKYNIKGKKDSLTERKKSRVEVQSHPSAGQIDSGDRRTLQGPINSRQSYATTLYGGKHG